MRGAAIWVFPEIAISRRQGKEASAPTTTNSVLLSVQETGCGTPGVLVNGRFDFQAPIATAWKLHSLWPRSELVVVNDAGHAASNPGITEELIRATDRFASG